MYNYEYKEKDLICFEEIAFQETSKIGELLTDAFQKVIDLRTKLYEEHKTESEVVTTIINYCVNELKDDMYKAFKGKHLNFDISTISMNIYETSSELGCYAILTKVENDTDNNYGKLLVEEKVLQMEQHWAK